MLDRARALSTISLLILCAPTPAHAGRAPTRASLLAQAQRARTQGNHSLALYFAEQAGRLQMTSSVRRFIAEEQRALDRPADALTSAERCVREADAEPPSENHGLVLTGCQEMVRALRPTLAQLSIAVIDALPAEAQIELDDQPIDRGALEPSRAFTRWLAPGPHVLRARRAGFAPTELRATLSAAQTWTARLLAPRPAQRRSCEASAEREEARALDALVVPGEAPAGDAQARVWLEVAPFAQGEGTIAVDGAPVAERRCPSPSAAASLDVAPGARRITFVRPGFLPVERAITVAPGADVSVRDLELRRAPVAASVRVERSRAWSPVGPVIGGVGALSMLTAAGLWGASSLSYDALRARCLGSGCPGDSQANIDANAIRALDTSATALLVIGGAALATGVVLSFTVRPERVVRVLASPSGAIVRGSF